MYLSKVERIDKERSDNWTANVNGVLWFVRHKLCQEVLFSHWVAVQTGLFASMVAAFIFFSYPLLQPDLLDTTNQLLTNISRQLSSNGTGSSHPFSPDPDKSSSSFDPPAYVMRVNILWFTSLALSTTCALWATLMQQWTRRYVQLANRPYATPNRARIRAFFADGAEKFALAETVEVLAALLHLSVFLFYLGLTDFLMNDNIVIGYIMLACFVIGCLTYLILTFMPIFYPNSPYKTPLSSLRWLSMEAMPLLGPWFRQRESRNNVQRKDSEHQTNIGKSMRQALEKKATTLTSWTDTIKALRWTLTSLDREDEFMVFLDGIPELFQGFDLRKGSDRHHSKVLERSLESLVEPAAKKLLVTCTTGFLPEEIQRQRLMACLRAIWFFSSTIDLHFQAIWGQWDRVKNEAWGPLSTETWTVASNMTMNPDPFTALRAHFIQALMAVMWKKDKWQCTLPEATALLQRQLGASSFNINRWHTSGDQLPLAVSANLLSHSLPILRELDNLKSGADTTRTLKKQLKEILDTICGELDASDVPHELQTRFAKRAEVMQVFDVAGSTHGRAAFDLNGPWTKIFTPVDIK